MSGKLVIQKEDVDFHNAFEVMAVAKGLGIRHGVIDGRDFFRAEVREKLKAFLIHLDFINCSIPIALFIASTEDLIANNIEVHMWLEESFKFVTA